MPAGQTKTKMEPSVAHLEALFTAFGLGLDFVNLIEVSAGISHCLLQRITS